MSSKASKKVIDIVNRKIMRETLEGFQQTKTDYARPVLVM